MVYSAGYQRGVVVRQVEVFIRWAEAAEAYHSDAEELCWRVGSCGVGRRSGSCCQNSQGLYHNENINREISYYQCKVATLVLQ